MLYMSDIILISDGDGKTAVGLNTSCNFDSCTCHLTLCCDVDCALVSILVVHELYNRDYNRESYKESYKRAI